MLAFASAICPSSPNAERSSCRMRGRAISPRSDQRLDVLSFRLNRCDLIGIRLHRGLAADDLRSELVDLLPDNAALTLDCRTPAFELADSTIPNRLEVVIFRPGLQILRQHNLCAAIELGQKARFGGPK